MTIRYYKTNPPSNKWIQEILSRRIHRRNGDAKYLFRHHLSTNEEISTLVIAKDNCQIIGWAVLAKHRGSLGSWCWGTQVFVKQKYRRQGIGSKCVREAINKIKCVDFDMSCFPKFWEHLGLSIPLTANRES